MKLLSLVCVLFSYFVGTLSIKGIECNICKAVISEIDDFLIKNATIEWLEKPASELCEYVIQGFECQKPHNSWQCKQVCEGLMNEYGYEVMDLITMRFIDPGVICYNHGYDCPKPTPQPITTPPPNVLTETGDRDASGIGYFIEFPDIHWDPWYNVGSAVDCGLPLCCRKAVDGHPYNNTRKAGVFGANGPCDIPATLLDSMWAFIKSNITTVFDVDFALFVGDVTPHDVWNESFSKKLYVNKDLYGMMQENLDVPVFVNLGNHEGMPIDQFNGPPRDDWLNDPLSELWSGWIDTPYSAGDTLLPSDLMRYGGFYTTLIRPGLRAIALNTGYMQPANFYLLFSGDYKGDLAGQYAWLSDVLEQSRALKQDVFIMQHVPFNELVPALENDYYSLYTSYADIIKGVFSGHTHNDEFHLFGTAPQTGELHTPYTMLYNPGSVTAYNGRSPHFRLFSYDRTTNELLDFTQYRFNMTESNKLGTPVWFKGYSAKEEYGLSGISGADFFKMTTAMATDDDLWAKYQYNYKGGLPSELERNATICHLLTAVVEEYEYCRLHLYNSDVTAQDWIEAEHGYV